MMSAPKCIFCDQPPAAFQGMVVQPPMCLLHYDLATLVEFMIGRGLPLTVEAVQAQLALALANGGEWTLTAAQIPELLPAYLAEREVA